MKSDWRKALVVAAVLWMTGVGLCLPAWANVIVVGPGDSIQDAIDAAQPGDEILIKPGTYTEDVLLNKEGIALRSEVAQGAKLVGSITFAVNEAKLHGFLIESPDGAGTWRGVDFDGNSGADVEIIDTVFSGKSGSVAAGIGLGQFGGGSSGGSWSIRHDGAITVDVSSEAYGIFVSMDDAQVSLTHSGKIEAKSAQKAYGLRVAATEIPSLVVEDDIHVEAFEGSGVVVSATKGASVTIRGHVSAAVTGPFESHGVSIKGGSGTVASVNSVSVDTVWARAVGVHFDVERDGSLSVHGPTVAKGYLARGVHIASGENTSTLIEGDINVSGRLIARGIELFAKANSRLTVTGNIHVTAAEPGEKVQATGVYLDDANTGDDLVAEIAGGVSVSAEGNGEATGVHFHHLNGLALTVTGDVNVQGEEAKGLLGLKLGSSRVEAGLVTVKAGGAGDGISLTIFHGSTLSAERVVVTAETARGVVLVAGENSTVDVGDVNVTGGKAAKGIELLSSGMDGPVSGVEVRAESVHVSAKESGSSAHGLHVVGLDDIGLELSSVSVEAGGEALGVLIAMLGENGEVSVGESVTVTARDEGSNAGGVVVAAQSAKVTNRGRVLVHADENAIGIGLLSQDPVIDMETAHLVNSGSIQVIGKEKKGVQLNVRQQATVENTGLIDAAGGIAIDGTESDAAITLINAGDILGDVLLGSGDDEVNLFYGGTLDGALDGGLGTDTLNLMGVMEGRPAAGGVTPIAVHHFEMGKVDGGEWLLTSGSDLGQVRVNEGVLRIAGSVSIDDVEVVGGTFGGDGSVTGSVVNAGGMVSTGEEMAVFKVVGAYTQEKGGTLEIKVAPAANPQPGVDYDQLYVSGGVGSFADGTTIRILPKPGLYQSKGYTIVDGDSIDVDVARLNLEIDRLFQSGTLKEGSIQLIIDSVPYETIATTGNQEAVARALYAAKAAAGNELDDVFAELDTLGSGDDPLARAAFDSLSGEVYTQAPVLALARFDRLVGHLDFRSLRNESSPAAMWAKAMMDSGRIAPSPGKAGADFRLTGLLIGADVAAAQTFRMGWMLGFDAGTLQMNARESVLTSNGHQVGAYGRIETERVSFAGLVAVGAGKDSSERRIRVNALSRVAEADYWLTGVGAVVEGRFVLLETAGGLRIEPVASIRWYGGTREAIEERGAGHAGLRSDAQAIRGTRGRFGIEVVSGNRGSQIRAETSGQSSGELLVQPAVRTGVTPAGHPGDGITSQPSGQTGRMSTRISLAWVGDLSHTSQNHKATVRFIGADAETFEVAGSESNPSGIEVGIGMTIPFSNERNLKLNYAGEFLGESNHHRLQAEVDFLF